MPSRCCHLLLLKKKWLPDKMNNLRVQALCPWCVCFFILQPSPSEHHNAAQVANLFATCSCIASMAGGPSPDPLCGHSSTLLYPRFGTDGNTSVDAPPLIEASCHRFALFVFLFPADTWYLGNQAAHGIRDWCKALLLAQLALCLLSEVPPTTTYLCKLLAL